MEVFENIYLEIIWDIFWIEGKVKMFSFQSIQAFKVSTPQYQYAKLFK